MKIFFVIVSSFFILTKTYATSGWSSQELKDIQKKVSSQKFLTVDFQQSTYRNLRKKTIVSTGISHFKKPSSFHWKLKTPKKTEWIFDGKNLLHYIDGNKTAARYGSSANKAKDLRQIVDLVLNFDSLMKSYSVVKYEKKNEKVSLTLEPIKLEKQIKSSVLKVEMLLDLTRNYISRVKLYFNGQNHTTFLFSNPRKISKENKAFTLSPHVKILDVL